MRPYQEFLRTADKQAGQNADYAKNTMTRSACDCPTLCLGMLAEVCNG